MKPKKGKKKQANNKSVKKFLHTHLPYPVLLIPGIFLLVSVILLLEHMIEWAFLSVGFAIVLAILIHKD